MTPVMPVTPEDQQLLRDRLEVVREKIANAEAQSPYHQKVKLMAVTKTVDCERINYVIDELGIDCIGENRPQELCEKYPNLHLDGVSVHQIGTLQSNKVKNIIDKVDLIHSLDSLSLARELERQATKREKTVDCLIELNIGEEENKGGILPDTLFSFYDALSEYPHIRVRGLMTIAPNTHDPLSYEQYFGKTRALYEQLLPKLSPDCKPVLSMGMSESFEVAIRHGADIVRVGSGIFGPRIMNKL